MPLYINGIGAISPQLSFAEALTEAHLVHPGNQLPCQEPDYTRYIEPRLLRRMSRIVKLGVASATRAAHDAGLAAVDGVLVGTGWGCIEDTVAFLQKMVENHEEALSPTAFIHSTHNTIAAQVAFQFRCRGYNTTYSHRAISFESALLDATLLLAENPAQQLLVGGVDELTSTSFDLLSRFNTFKPEADITSDSLFDSHTDGTVAGEGAVFVLASGVPGPHTYCQLAGSHTLSFGSTAEAAAAARQLLARHHLAAPDVLLLGRNGDASLDAGYDELVQALAPTLPRMDYKHLCGEYPTASAFGLGLGATLLRHGAPNGQRPQSVLCYNRSPRSHQSLMLLTAC